MRQQRAALEGEATLRQIAADGLLPVEEEPLRIDGDPVPLAEHVEGRSQPEPLMGGGDLRLPAGEFGQERGPAAPGADAETDSPVELVVRFSKHPPTPSALDQNGISSSLAAFSFSSAGSTVSRTASLWPSEESARATAADLL